MRLRFCYFCNGEGHENMENRRRKEIVFELQTTGPPLKDQPKRRSESAKIDRVSNKEKDSNASFTTTPAALFTTSSNIIPTVSATSNFSYITKNGERTKMTLNQVEPGHHRGTYKGSQFDIVNEELRSPNGAYNQFDKELILENYSQAILAMQQGVLGIEKRLRGLLDSQLPPLNRRQMTELTIPSGLTINVTYTTDEGEKSKITFKQIQPGLFRGTYNDKIYTIANGQILTLDGGEHGLNKSLLLSTFYRAMLGMQQTSLGLNRGELAIEARLSGNQLNPMELLKAACPERRILFETESLKVHNEFRHLHGVPPLTHSEYLCELAREWAEHLALKDRAYKRPNNEYGENLFYSQGMLLDARKVITTWYDEINLYNYNDPQFSKEIGHFTQLVWKDTKEMGTGIAQLGDKVWVCCYYHPAGNIPSNFCEEIVPRPREREVT